MLHFAQGLALKLLTNLVTHNQIHYGAISTVEEGEK
jgi:hypothetical protein